MKKCVVNDCNKFSHARGKYCSMHEARKRRTGSLELNPISDIERFMSTVEKNTSSGCWIWKGWTGKRGYGRFSLRKQHPAHRASYILFKGEVTHGLLVCHSCDNPSCVNPDHLWLGTNYDNAQDKIKKGRNSMMFGHKFNQKYSENVSLNIKYLMSIGFKASVLSKIFKIPRDIIYYLRKRT